MAKQNLSVTYQRCFVDEGCICQWLNFFFSSLLSAVFFQVLFFYKGIYLIKHCVAVTSNKYYATDGHFLKSLILKSITES